MQIKQGDKVLVKDRSTGEIGVCIYRYGSGRIHLLSHNNFTVVVGIDKALIFVYPNTPKLKAMLEGVK